MSLEEPQNLFGSWERHLSYSRGNIFRESTILITTSCNYLPLVKCYGALYWGSCSNETCLTSCMWKIYFTHVRNAINHAPFFSLIRTELFAETSSVNAWRRVIAVLKVLSLTPTLYFLFQSCKCARDFKAPSETSACIRAFNFQHGEWQLKVIRGKFRRVV